MKFTFFTIFTFVLFSSNAQTSLIAHKSHSGNKRDYLIDPNSNFGRDNTYDAHEMVFLDPSLNEYRYKRINATLVYRFTENGAYGVAIDTIKKPKKISYRKFKKLQVEKDLQFQDSIRNLSRIDKNILHTRGEAKPQKGPIQRVSKSKSNPSFFFVLLSVSAVLMVLVRLVVRERK